MGLRKRKTITFNTNNEISNVLKKAGSGKKSQRINELIRKGLAKEREEEEARPAQYTEADIGEFLDKNRELMDRLD